MIGRNRGRLQNVLLLLLAALLTGCSGAVEATPDPVEPTPSPDSDTANLADDQVVIDEDSPSAPQPEPASPPPEPVAETVEANPESPSARVEEPPTKTTTDPTVDPEAPFCQRNRTEKQMAARSTIAEAKCAEIDRLVYYSRESVGRCGPTTRLEIRAGGKITHERSAAACSAGECCQEPMISKKVIKAKRAAGIIADICADHRDVKQNSHDGCAATSTRFYFFQGNSKVSGTRALPCDGEPMKSSIAQIQKLLGMFD